MVGPVSPGRKGSCRRCLVITLGAFLYQLKLPKEEGSSEIWLRRALSRVESRWQNIPGGGEEMPRFGGSGSPGLASADAVQGFDASPGHRFFPWEGTESLRFL